MWYLLRGFPHIQFYYLYVEQTAPVAVEARACIRGNYSAFHFNGFLDFNRPLTAAGAFRTTDVAAVLALYCIFFKKNLNASRPSEHPGEIIFCKDKRVPMVSQ